MASLPASISTFSHNRLQNTGLTLLMFRDGNLNFFRTKLPFKPNNFHISRKSNRPTWAKSVQNSTIRRAIDLLGVSVAHGIYPTAANATIPSQDLALSEAMQRTPTTLTELSESVSENMRRLSVIAELDSSTAKLAIAIIGPFLSAFGFLFVLRIVMSWYPKLPVGKFPFVIAYAPTEPLLGPTRKVIPPVGGVDVTPVIWFGLTSFLNEILVGPQGLLVLLSQQI